MVVVPALELRTFDRELRLLEGCPPLVDVISILPEVVVHDREDLDVGGNEDSVTLALG